MSLRPTPRVLRRLLPTLVAGALALSTTSCYGSRSLQDPTVLVRTPRGSELGVSTDFGVVFLGRTASAGEVDVIAWFGDGPSVESSVIEPLGGGIFTAEMEIRLPSTPMTFQIPSPGNEVRIIGRRGQDRWESRATLQSDERVEGILLNIPHDLKNDANQVGAGVFVERNGESRLLGLISGQLVLEDENGRERRYLTVMGPEHLWRLPAQRRPIEQKQRWVYRDDIL